MPRLSTAVTWTKYVVPAVRPGRVYETTVPALGAEVVEATVW
jgi:hypothetical protein